MTRRTEDFRSLERVRKSVLPMPAHGFGVLPLPAQRSSGDMLRKAMVQDPSRAGANSLHRNCRARAIATQSRGDGVWRVDTDVEGQPVREANQLRPILSDALEQQLSHLAERALLIA
jgi:hypothetical protein